MTLTVARTRFERSDAYAIIDLPASPIGVGPIRCARKVLERTTIDLIRHATYALAAHGLEASGAAVALNHDRATGDDSVFGNFADELRDWAALAGFRPTGGMGLGLDEVGVVAPPMSPEDANARSAVAAAGPLAGADVVVASTAEEAALHAALDAAGARSVRFEPDLAVALEIECDATFVRGPIGVLHHEVLEGTRARRIVGLQPLTTTARGLAFASRAGAVVVPDFVSAGGQYLAVMDVDVATATADVAARSAGAGTDAFVHACELAEDHLRSWAGGVPFGRPLAP